MKKIIIGLIGIALFSCSKDDDTTVIAGGSTSANLSAKIKTERTIVGDDTLNANTTYYYYTEGLLTKKVFGSSRWNSFDSITYEYDVNNELQYSFRTRRRNGIKDTSEIYEYNGQGLLTNITTYDIEEDTVSGIYTLGYSNQKLNRLTENVLGYYSEEYSVKTDAKENLTEAILVKEDNQPATKNFKIIFEFNDDKNPFLKLANNISPIWEYICPNNVTSIKYYEENVLNDERDYIYTFNSLRQLETIKADNVTRTLSYY